MSRGQCATWSDANEREDVTELPELDLLAHLPTKN
jgi:hypothetical protein